MVTTPAIDWPVAGFFPGPYALDHQNREELALRRIDSSRRHAIVETLAHEIEDHYVFADVAQRMSESLTQKGARGEYDRVTDATAFAETLTEDLRQVSHDKHLQVFFDPVPPPPPPPPLNRVRWSRDHRKRATCAASRAGSDSS
jgi:hypothetical protein